MTESCILITEEQYKEWKRADEEIDELTKQLMKVNKLWEQTIKANKMYGRKLDIALNGLHSIFDIDSDYSGDYYSRVHEVIEEIKEVQ